MVWPSLAPAVTPTARGLTSSALLGLAVGGALLIGLGTGHTAPAGRAAAAMILVALPSIPAEPAAAARTLAARTAAVVAGALAALLVDGQETAVAIGIVLAAALGFLVPILGSTPALAILLAGLRLQVDPQALALPGMWELVGALVVATVTLAARLVPAAAAAPAEPAPPPGRLWTARRVASVAAAVLLALATPLGVYGGHWLITAVLLSVRPTPSATRARLSQRLLGNTVAALLVAVLMATGVGAPALALVVAALTALAFALRPVSYLWWAVAAPPVLLVVGDFPTAHDWYEGMVRVALNVVGALIVLTICYVPRSRRTQ